MAYQLSEYCPLFPWSQLNKLCSSVIMSNHSWFHVHTVTRHSDDDIVAKPVILIVLSSVVYFRIGYIIS